MTRSADDGTQKERPADLEMVKDDVQFQRIKKADRQLAMIAKTFAEDGREEAAEACEDLRDELETFMYRHVLGGGRQRVSRFLKRAREAAARRAA